MICIQIMTNLINVAVSVEDEAGGSVSIDMVH